MDDNGTSDDTTDDITVGDVYKEDGEGWPVYQELRSNVIASADFTEGTINGIVFVDSNSATSAVSDYVSYGPNNELYLAPGQSIIFSLNPANYSEKIATVQLGMKSVDANGASYVIIDGTTLEKLEDLTGADKTVLKTTTDMYYDITALKDAVIVIYNAGEEGVLSLTDIKVTFKENPGTIDTLCYVDYDVISAVVESMNSTNTEEETEETFEPTVTVRSSSTTVDEGGYVTVTVTTSNNVEAVSVDGKVVSTYIVDGDNRVWTTDVTEISADSEAGTKTIEVVAYDSVGNASEPEEIIITVNDVEQSVTNSVKSIISNIFSKLKDWFGW